MSESVIADFVATFNSEASARAEPTKGRMLLSEKRLVLAGDEGRVTIPLSSVFDVAVGQVPDELGDFFNSTVTVAFEREDRGLAAAIESDDETVDKFATVLFKTILNETTMTVKHPARVGGRITDKSFVPGKLYLAPRAVRFELPDGKVSISLPTVSGFDRLTREIDGFNQPVLAVEHMPDGQVLTTLAATQSKRKMSILGRYLRLEYSDLMAELDDVDLSRDETRTLVAIYSSGPGVSLPAILDMDGSQVTMLVNDLEDDELIVDSEEGPQLTPKGRVIVSNHLEDVNE